MPERPEAPLRQELERLIALEGPLTVERYMMLSLAHPVLGYYHTRDPLGRAGDFVTAPEISQMFGEMIGLWAVSLWAQMGKPARFALVELGPGRGTLMADMLRAAKAMPGFREAARIVLVETSPALRAVQEKTLASSGASPRWMGDSADLPSDLPLIIVANEFFDALPIRQVMFTEGAWRERLVGLGPDGRLCFGLAAEPLSDIALPGHAGDIRESCPGGQRLMRDLASRIVAQGGALLTVDYGTARSRCGDSFQAMKGHAFADPLEEPGEADLTAHVDFAALAGAAKSGGATIMPLLTQKTLLERLGIRQRAQALANAAPERAGDIDAALRRLAGTGEGQMGTLFKALAIGAPVLAALPAFDVPDPLLQGFQT